MIIINFITKADNAIKIAALIIAYWLLKYFLPWLFEWIKWKSLNRKWFKTLSLLRKKTLGWIIGISGKIGAGKSILLAALSNALTIVLKEKLSLDIHKMRSIFYQVNYNDMNDKIDKLMEYKQYTFFKTNSITREKVIIIVDPKGGMQLVSNNITYDEYLTLAHYIVEYPIKSQEVAEKEKIYAIINKEIKKYKFAIKRYANINYRAIRMKLLMDPDYKEYLVLAYFDGFFKRSFEEYLRKYVRAYCRLKQGYFVLANVDIESRITRQKSKKAKSHYLHAKDGDTPLEYGLIYAEDEKSIEDGNTKTHSIKNADTGQDTVMKLGRNAFEELFYMLLASQNFARIVKLYREVANSNLYIKGFQIIEVFKSRKKRIIKKRNHLGRWQLFYFIVYPRYWFKEQRNRYANKNNFFKRRNFKLFDKENKLYAKSFIVFHAIAAFNVTDQNSDGKSAADAQLLKLYFPLPYAFAVDTHEYKYFAERLIEESRTSWEEISVEEAARRIQQTLDADEMLKKEYLKDAERKEENRKELERKKRAELLATLVIDWDLVERLKRGDELEKDDKKKINKLVYAYYGPFDQLSYEERGSLYIEFAEEKAEEMDELEERESYEDKN